VAEPFRVDTDALADAAQRMTEFQRCAEQLLTEIDSLVTNLHTTWTGRGAAAHAEAHRHWARGEAMMREALAHLRTSGATAHRNYTGAMSTNVGMWS
jgi:WXG100 family type VII secretion target